ncbi:MAG: phosphoribosylformylglycinamidine synthase subunit PurQ [Candidatus Dormibacteria bacterium]
MRFGIVVFPGTWSDRDCGWVVESVLEHEVRYLWHEDADLGGSDCVILPGGYSFGDYLRCGAIARFSPVMQAVEEFAHQGGLVWGICNGFQVLCEAGLLPGALITNDSLEFRCEMVGLRCENNYTPYTRLCHRGQVIRVPISHEQGNYFADPATLAELESGSQVVFRYCGPEGEIGPEHNPNGSLNSIAGIVNRQGNVLGMMPHPERCCERLVGGADGLLLFQSVLRQAEALARA